MISHDRTADQSHEYLGWKWNDFFGQGSMYTQSHTTLCRGLVALNDSNVIFLKKTTALGKTPNSDQPFAVARNIIGSAEALPILCVRYFWWERERERERERLIPKTIGNRKRDCAWGCAWGINTTRENLQIEKHKSVRWAERTPSWFVLFDLQIFSGGVYSPSATSRTISFSISNSFWY